MFARFLFFQQEINIHYEITIMYNLIPEKKLPIIFQNAIYTFQSLKFSSNINR